MSSLHNIDVLEMHSRKSQPHRAHVSHKFKSETRQILFTSDVSARGIDFPDVTCCFQIGLPQTLGNYIHRCGRSGRGLRGGLSILLISDFERVFIEELESHDIIAQRLNVSLDECLDKISPPADFVPSKELVTRAKMHYQAWIGYYCSHFKRLKIEKESIISMSRSYSSDVLLLEEIPAIKASTAEKMNIVDIEGVRIESSKNSDGKRTKTPSAQRESI